MSDSIIIAIIGLVSSFIGAVFSTLSIILTGINTKKIKILENSKDVKTKISLKRSEVYERLIKYIESWYDVHIDDTFDYINCPSRNYLRHAIFHGRFNTYEDIQKERICVSNICVDYFYLDSKTYKILKALENYLQSAILCSTYEKIENKELFLFAVYNDVFMYMTKLAKEINKYIKVNDTLQYRQSRIIKKWDLMKFYRNTNLHRYYECKSNKKGEIYYMLKLCPKCSNNCPFSMNNINSI